MSNDRNYKVSGKKMRTAERNVEMKCWNEGVKKGILPSAKECPPTPRCEWRNVSHNNRQMKKFAAKKGKRLGRVEAVMWAQEMEAAEMAAYYGY